MIRLIVVCFLATIVLSGVAVFAPGVYAEIFTNNDQPLVKLTPPGYADLFLRYHDLWHSVCVPVNIPGLGGQKCPCSLRCFEGDPADSALQSSCLSSWGVIGIYRAEPVAETSSQCYNKRALCHYGEKVLRNMGEQ